MNGKVIALIAVIAAVAIGVTVYTLMDGYDNMTLKEQFEEGDYFEVTYSETGADGITVLDSQFDKLEIASVNADGTYMVYLDNDKTNPVMLTYEGICERMKITDASNVKGTELIDAYYKLWGPGDYNSYSYKIAWTDDTVVMECTWGATDNGQNVTVNERISSNMFVS